MRLFILCMVAHHATPQTTCGDVKTLFQTAACCADDASRVVNASIQMDAQTRFFDAANFAVTTFGVADFTFTPQALGAPIAPPAGAVGTFRGMNRDVSTLEPTKHDQVTILADGSGYFQASTDGAHWHTYFPTPIQMAVPHGNKVFMITNISWAADTYMVPHINIDAPPFGVINAMGFPMQKVLDMEFWFVVFMVDTTTHKLSWTFATTGVTVPDNDYTALSTMLFRGYYSNPVLQVERQRWFASKAVAPYYYVAPTCIVGGGSGAAGAALALQHHGSTGNAIVLDSGFDSNRYDTEAKKWGGHFPSFQITASDPSSWKSTDIEAPWRTVYSSDPNSFPQWMALANTVGGQAMFNGGFWGHPGNMSTIGMSAAVISAIANVTESVGAPYTCTGRCAAMMTAARNIVSDDVTVYAHPIAMDATGARLNMQKEINKTGIAILASRKVHAMESKDDGSWLLVDDNEQPLATCGRVLLAAGAIGTPALIRRSADLANYHDEVGKNMVDHVGVVYVGTFGNSGNSTNLNEAGGSYPIVTSNDGFAHTYVQCFDPTGFTITCYFIPTGSNIPDSMRDEQSSVSADETHTFRFDPTSDAVYKTSTMETLKHAIAMTEEVHGSGSYFGLSSYGVPEVNYQMTGAATPVDFTAPIFMSASETQNDHEHRVSTTTGLYGIYHAMGTTYDLVHSSNSHIIPDTKIAFGDASVFSGTPGGMMSLTAMAHGYIGMTELLSAS